MDDATTDRPPTAQERLLTATEDVRGGRHARALAGFVWFHRHALAQAPVLAGVRRSFALRHWADLCVDYPPALDALHAIRQEDAAALLAGEESLERFRDVVAIDLTLGETARTHTLFVALACERPGFAAECADDALPALVEARAFSLAARYLADPARRVRRLTAKLVEETEAVLQQGDASSARLGAQVRVRAEQIGQVLAVLRGTGREDEASRLASFVQAGLPSAALRMAVASRCG